ncbi:MAG: S26 family signal peptidase, partial [Pseudomonadota bacterium]
MLTCFAGIAIYAPTDIKSQTHIFYNFTPSAPIGFYRPSQENLKKGSWVVVRLDLRYLKYSYDTFAKQHVKLLKPVAALQDDRICRSQTALYINGKFASHISHKQNA